MAEDLKTLIHARGAIKATVTRFETYCKSLNNSSNVTEVNSRFSKFKETWDEFNKIQLKIELLDDTPKQSEERESFENQYFKLDTTVEEFLATRSVKQSITPASSQHSINADTATNYQKLPRMKLPEFSGKIGNWFSFSERFISSIHNNSSLNDLEKLHYLKSCLIGESASLIETLSISNDNYSVAWNLLKSRYENKRLIIRTHVRALCTLQPVQKNCAESLRKLLNTVTLNLNLLQNLNQPVEYWDLLIIENITSNLDYTTIREWENTKIAGDAPTFKEMSDFLTKKCQLLETLEFGRMSQNVSSSGTNQNKKYSAKNSGIKSTVHVTANKPSCQYCRQSSHYLNQCQAFLKLPIESRITEVKNLQICSNCFRSNHLLSKCIAKVRCKLCGMKHHTILHVEVNNTQEETKASLEAENNTPAPVTNYCNIREINAQVLLSTAIIYAKDSQGNYQKLRSLLDMGSQSHFITETACKKLNLKYQSTTMPISGINQSTSTVRKMTNLNVKSKYNNFYANISCLVLDKITANLPLISFDAGKINIPANINLADPDFNITSPIDLLIGAELFWDLLCNNQIKIGPGKPHLQETQLGWIIGGNLDSTKSPQRKVSNLAISNLEAQVERFWEIEEFSNKKQIYSQEELDCDNFFLDTHMRDNTGRFVVQLPFKDNAAKLGDSKTQALNRFYSLERKLAKNPAIKISYVNFMKEYSELGHMSPISVNDGDNPQNEFYLPHHAVYKESSATTKVRIVYDGSSKSNNGTSLNDTLLVGPKIQQDLFAILTRFRIHQYAFSSDIVKMYRQILIAPRHRNYQRIFWRENPNDPLQIFTLNTVTYGTSSAPYLAIRSLQQLAVDERKNYPLAHDVILRDFYVDDVLTGADSFIEANNLQNQLIATLKRGGFTLQKWASNDPRLIKNSELSNETHVNLDKQDETKILGLIWGAERDILKFSIKDCDNQTKPTKRGVLSVIAQLFDPLGLVGPVLISAKIILQNLWAIKLNWDDPLPANLETSWLDFTRQLPILNTLSIDRKVIPKNAKSYYELHGFSDASSLAFGTCVYLRTINEHGEFSANLVAAKSRVAPLKALTIPRLELCGALLLSRLMDKIKDSLHISVHKYYYWTDSTIVLAWLAGHSSNWKTFVSNRVTEIQNLTNISSWNHINSKENPADLISRGVTPEALIQSHLWFHGPSWLSRDSREWPRLKPEHEIQCAPEKRIISIATIIPEIPLFTKYSEFNKLQRVMAYCIRFIHNVRNKHIKLNGTLTCRELRYATEAILQYIQLREFAIEIKRLKGGHQIERGSPLLSLNPFLDNSGLLRVGGRLKNSSLEYDVKHPVILPARHHVTKLLIQQAHKINLHAGQQATLSFLRQNYWPLSGRNFVRQVIHECIKCFRARPTGGNQQIMGDLPVSRLEPARPFINCGLDFGGPVNLKEGRGRGKKSMKAYIALFVCLATKAIHLELVGDLTSETFLNAFKRFISRRGSISNIYCDNATNFKGAQRELLNLNHIFNSDKANSELLNESAKLNITWHFIPPRSPHFGGIWEAGIKSVKYFLKRIVGDASITYEEMYTLLTQIEAILNSRPLTSLSNDPNDLSALTPGHFLIGTALTAPLEPDLRALKTNRLSRWQRIEQLRQHFWKRWSLEYITQLQQRTRWKGSKGPMFNMDMLVLIRDDNLPPLQWRLGRIVQVHPGKDNIVRVVSIKTSSGVLKRATAKLCVLPIEGNI